MHVSYIYINVCGCCFTVEQVNVFAPCHSIWSAFYHLIEMRWSNRNNHFSSVDSARPHSFFILLGAWFIDSLLSLRRGVTLSRSSSPKIGRTLGQTLFKVVLLLYHSKIFLKHSFQKKRIFQKEYFKNFNRTVQSSAFTRKCLGGHFFAPGQWFGLPCYQLSSPFWIRRAQFLVLINQISANKLTTPRYSEIFADTSIFCFSILPWIPPSYWPWRIAAVSFRDAAPT